MIEQNLARKVVPLFLTLSLGSAACTSKDQVSEPAYAQPSVGPNGCIGVCLQEQTPVPVPKPTGAYDPCAQLSEYDKEYCNDVRKDLAGAPRRSDKERILTVELCKNNKAARESGNYSSSRNVALYLIHDAMYGLDPRGVADNDTSFRAKEAALPDLDLAAHEICPESVQVFHSAG